MSQGNPATGADRIIVSYKSDIVGAGVFWRGYIAEIDQIANGPARELAHLVARDGITRSTGMWTVELEALELTLEHALAIIHGLGWYLVPLWHNGRAYEWQLKAREGINATHTFGTWEAAATAVCRRPVRSAERRLENEVAELRAAINRWIGRMNECHGFDWWQRAALTDLQSAEVDLALLGDRKA